MWELIESQVFDLLTIVSHRLWVPSGWIIRTVTANGYQASHTAMIYILDHDHLWDLPPKPEVP